MYCQTSLPQVGHKEITPRSHLSALCQGSRETPLLWALGDGPNPYFVTWLRLYHGRFPPTKHRDKSLSHKVNLLSHLRPYTSHPVGEQGVALPLSFLQNSITCSKHHCLTMFCPLSFLTSHCNTSVDPHWRWFKPNVWSLCEVTFSPVLKSSWPCLHLPQIPTISTQSFHLETLICTLVQHLLLSLKCSSSSLHVRLRFRFKRL